MAFHWRADDGPTLNTGLVFQGIRANIAKKPYSFEFILGGPDPLPSTHAIDLKPNWPSAGNRYTSIQLCSGKQVSLYQ